MKRKIATVLLASALMVNILGITFTKSTEPQPWSLSNAKFIATEPQPWNISDMKLTATEPQPW